MGLWSRLIGKSTTFADSPAQWFIDWIRGGAETISGISVTPESAMRQSAVFACVRIRSEDIGKLPCLLYERQPDGGKERAVNHPLFSLIRDQPNPYQTALEFRQLLQAWVDLRGNGYALKEYDAQGRIIALWPLNPTWITVLYVQDTWELFYRINVPGPGGWQKTVPQEALLHIRGMTLDGFCGLSPIAYHRETIGLAVAAQTYGAAFFGNSAQPQGALKMPGVISPEASAALRADWEKKFKGAKNAKKLAIFDGGMEWVQTGMDNTDAQYLETRQMQNRQIFSIYRMPPHKVGDLDKATFSNIEQQALEYVTDCLMTEMVRWEQALKRDLLLEEEKSKYFFEFMPDALLRGDLKSRFEAYAIARNWGIFSVNDCRERENLNHVANGDIYLQPLNMIEAGTMPPPAAAAKRLVSWAQLIVARAAAEDAAAEPPAQRRAPRKSKSNGHVKEEHHA